MREREKEKGQGEKHNPGFIALDLEVGAVLGECESGGLLLG